MAESGKGDYPRFLYAFMIFANSYIGLDPEKRYHLKEKCTEADDQWE